MDYRILEGTERDNFIHNLVGGNLRLMFTFESLIFSRMECNNPDYSGGMWDFIEYENGAKAMVFGSVEEPKVKVPAQMNYWEGEMTPFSLSIALNMFICSNMSFEAGGENLGENYHLLVASIDEDFDEAGAIFGFID